MKTLSGTGVALVTPFNTDLSVDFESLEKLVKHVSPHVDYLVVLGTTSEAPTLSAEEKKQVIETIVKANNTKTKMVLTIGGNHTYTVTETIKNTDLSSFEAILSVTPYYNKPSQKGLYEHFKSIAEASPLPIILYNVPSRTGVNLEADTVISLASDFSNIVGVKEAGGNFRQWVDIFKGVSKDFNLISGDDSVTLAVILHGGVGVISVLAQAFPESFSKMVQAALEKDYETAKSIFYQLHDAMKAIFEEGSPTGIKSLLNHLGVCKSKAVRLPLVEASDGLHQKIKNIGIFA